MATQPTRISNDNYFWLMDNRGAGSPDNLISILIEHAKNCQELKEEILEGTKAKNIKKK